MDAIEQRAADWAQSPMGSIAIFVVVMLGRVMAAELAKRLKRRKSHKRRTAIV